MLITQRRTWKGLFNFKNIIISIIFIKLIAIMFSVFFLSYDSKKENKLEEVIYTK